jgi:23S rRNA maturation mini-RNase III
MIIARRTTHSAMLAASMTLQPYFQNEYLTLVKRGRNSFASTFVMKAIPNVLHMQQ